MDSNWADQASGLECILKALVLDLNRVYRRIDGLENDHNSEVVSFKKEISALATNLQGFAVQNEAIKGGRQERQLLRNSLFRCIPPELCDIIQGGSLTSDAARMVKDDASFTEPTLFSLPKAISCRYHPQSILYVNNLRSKQRWHWVLMKLKLQRIREKTPMNYVNVGRRNALALRFADVEGLVNIVGHRVNCLLNHAGPDKMIEATDKLRLIHQALWGGAEIDSTHADGMFLRLLDLEKTVSIVHELSLASSVRCKAIESYCEDIQQNLKATTTRTKHTLEDVSSLKKEIRDNEALSRLALPQAREEARMLIRALGTSCLIAMGSTQTANLPGGNDLIQTRLLPMHTQLELSSGPLKTIVLESKVGQDEWRKLARALARYLYFALSEDTVQVQKNATLSFEDNHATLIDIPFDPIEVKTSVEGDIGAIVIATGKKKNLRELADDCLRSLNAALEADPDEASTQAGTLALQNWYAGVDGPDGRWQQSQFHSLRAGIVALQTSLTYMPGDLAFSDLNQRMRLIEDAKSQPEKNSHSHDDVMRHVRHEFELVHSLLAEAAEEIGRFQSELKTKAGHVETQSALDLLKRELHELALDTVGRQQIQFSLKSKLDRRDLHRVSALIANGEVEGMNPSVVRQGS